MSRRASLLRVIETDIQQDCADYLGLRGVMQELYASLMNKDCVQIDLLNREILRLVAALDERSQRRTKVLAVFGLAPDAPGMQALLAGFPPREGQSLSQTWQQLGQLTQQCRRLNERNGALLAMHHDILSQLLGEAGGDSLYRAQGY